VRRSDETAASCDLVDTESAHCFEGSLTEVLGEHILSLVSLAMAGVAHHGDGHLLVNGVLGEHTLEAIGEAEEVGVCGQASLKHTGSQGHLLGLELQRRAVKVTPALMGSKGGSTGVLVTPILGRLGRLLNEVTAVLLGRILIESHGVLQIILKISLRSVFEKSSVVLLVESSLVSRLKFIRRALVDSTLDAVAQTLRSILGVGLPEGILTLDSRDVSSVTRNLLRTDVMEGSIDPSPRVTAKISNCNSGFSFL